MDGGAAHAGSSRADVVSSLVPLFSLSVSGEGSSVMKSLPEFDCRNTLAGLAGSSISCSPIDSRVLGNYFSHFISGGFVEPPPSVAASARAFEVPAQLLGGTTGTESPREKRSTGRRR